MKMEEIIQTTSNLTEAKKAVLNIMFTQSFMSEAFNEILKQYDISSEQFNVLRILRGQKGNPVNMYSIQERMITKNSNTTRLIDKLLLKSLVTRNVCPANRRKIEILITQKGLDLLTELDPKVIEFENKFADTLSSNELQQLNILLEKYRTIKN
jgi:DNA-binding MarR family transcriptional regulator